MQSSNVMANNVRLLHDRLFKNIVSLDKLLSIQNRLFGGDYNSFENFMNMKEDTSFTFNLSNISFDSLDSSILNTMYKDGRAFSHLSELWLQDNCPMLKHVTKCKDHDFINRTNDTKYDAKTWTSNKLDFRPSNMLGKGRSFDKEVFDEKCNKLTYIVVSNINFPEIKVRFIKGCDLVQLYPKGYISTNKNELDKFFI